jgi:hypothetical protein
MVDTPELNRFELCRVIWAQSFAITPPVIVPPSISARITTRTRIIGIALRFVRSRQIDGVADLPRSPLTALRPYLTASRGSPQRIFQPDILPSKCPSPIPSGEKGRSGRAR